MTPPTPAAPRSHANTRWPRHAFRVALCLFAGFVITIGVAWGLALALDLTSNRTTRLIGVRERVASAGEGAGSLTVDRFSRFGSVFVYSQASPGKGLELTQEDADGVVSVVVFPSPEEVAPDALRSDVLPWRTGTWPTALLDNREIEVRGWPMLALWCRYRMTRNPAAGATTGASTSPASGPDFIGVPEGGWSVPIALVDKGAMVGVQYIPALPLRPLWTGLMVNTLFYAAIIYACTFGLDALRRSLRARKGLCPHCRYDLRATPQGSPCPECGAPPRASTTA